MTRKRIFSVLTTCSLALGLWACDSSDNDNDVKSGALPSGFKEAVETEVTMGADWHTDESCYGSDEPSTLKVTVRDGELRVLYKGCFPCEVYKQEAYIQKTQGVYEILFQPVDTEFSSNCGSNVYTMRLYAGSGEVGDTVRVYVRRSLDSDPIQKAEAVADAEPVDCAELTACDARTPCEYEGRKMDERADDYTMGCTTLDSCGGGSYCVWDAEACMMECKEPTCTLNESYPMSVGCE